MCGDINPYANRKDIARYEGYLDETDDFMLALGLMEDQKQQVDKWNRYCFWNMGCMPAKVYTGDHPWMVSAACTNTHCHIGQGHLDGQKYPNQDKDAAMWKDYLGECHNADSAFS